MKINDLNVTCEMCPAQLEGETDDGYFIYARIRHSRFSVSIDRETPYLGEAEYSLSGNLPGKYGTGTVYDLQELVRLYVRMIAKELL